MKVRVQIEQTVEYYAEVDMSADELNEWEAKFRTGRSENDVAEDLIQRCHCDGMRLGEPNGWGDLRVETLEPIVRKRKRA